MEDEALLLSSPYISSYSRLEKSILNELAGDGTRKTDKDGIAYRLFLGRLQGRYSENRVQSSSSGSLGPRSKWTRIAEELLQMGQPCSND